MKAVSGQKWTARQLAKQFKCGTDTITNHANKLFGKCAKGKTRYFDELQTTIILESIKSSTSNQHGTSEAASEVETSLSLDLEIALAEKKAKELWKKRVLQAEQSLSRVSMLLEHRTNGLEFYQRAAESAGLTLTDKDDLYAAYRRG